MIFALGEIRSFNSKWRLRQGGKLFTYIPHKEKEMHSRPSYSIEAEDLIVDRIFHDMLQNPRNCGGFYVDLGACDPIRASNTFYFYGLGWRGLNVEPNPDVLERFRVIRDRDISITAAVGSDGTTGQYIQWNDPLLNGFLPDDLVQHHIAAGYRVIGRRQVAMRSVNAIMAEHVPQGVRVDFLNIDIENMELPILSEWDFARWKPQVIAVEIHCGDRLAIVEQMPVARLLAERGYSLVSRIWHTSIFAALPERR